MDQIKTAPPAASPAVPARRATLGPALFRPFSRVAASASPDTVAPSPPVAPAQPVAAAVARPAFSPMRAVGAPTRSPGDPAFAAAPAAARRAPPAPPEAEELEEARGTVRREIFRAADSGYTVLSVDFDGRVDDCTLQVTSTLRPNQRDRIVAQGRWIVYKGKPQFKADVVQLEIERGTAGIAKWLKNGGVPGVGPGTVAKLVKHFGDLLPEVIGDAIALASAKIPEAKAREIARCWTSNADQPELVALLGGLGLGPKQIARVIERYGASIKKLVKTNPWELVEIEGIGFPTTDAMARAADLDMTCANRMRAGLSHVLSETLNSEGHCGLPEGQLVHEAARVLEVDHEVVEASLASFLDGVRAIRDEDGLIYARLLWEAEVDLCDRLVAMLSQGSPSAPSRAAAEQAVASAERELGVELDREGGQFEAAVVALSSPLCVITGGPGTGKSTAQGVIKRALETLERRFAMAAPTGRAAKRLSETSGTEAKTLHRLLEFSPITGDFSYGPSRPLPLDALVVDEFSMVDLRLACSAMGALGQRASAIIVGDFDQLPSVGPGQVLRDLIESGVVPVVRLTRVRRQAAGSGIAIAAQRIRQGLPPEEPDTRARGFRVVDVADHEGFDEVVRLVRFDLPEMGFDPMRDIQVLAGMRVGEFGVDLLNDALKSALNPALDDDASVPFWPRRKDDRNPEGGMRRLTVGDRVMQTRNDYMKGVYNGEVGTVAAVGVDVDREGRRTIWATVDYSGVDARYKPEEHADLLLAYAATVHKSQGCEFPVVVFFAPRAHRRMLNRNLLYTGVTRARTECVVVGSRAVVDACVAVADASRRHTGLRRRLRASLGLPAEDLVAT